MNLRKEIENIILYERFEDSLTSKELADKITKAVEMRLDTIIADINMDMEFVSKNNLKNHSNSVQLHHIYKLKELLK
jgi:hypothetical protein